MAHPPEARGPPPLADPSLTAPPRSPALAHDHTRPAQQAELPSPIPLFARFGVELEYMIVDRRTLDVRPICDELFVRARRALAEKGPATDPAIEPDEHPGDVQPQGEDGPIAWSNELALHVCELKTNRPAPSLTPLAAEFHRSVGEVNRLLAAMDAQLMPSAMHPWMDPVGQMKLWPHEYNDVYRAFDRIFGCKGHGWANLQSTHLNLPFADDDQFARLHAAIRPVLPLIPGLAAGSPFADGKATGLADTRLEMYRNNSRILPLIAGRIVPEAVRSIDDYHSTILQPMFRSIAHVDPDGTLQHEWLNARGAIARFGRGSIEIRLIDIQECPSADLAIVTLIAALVRALVEERWASMDSIRELGTEPLHEALLAGIRLGEHAPVEHRPLLAALGVQQPRATMGEIWNILADRLVPVRAPSGAVLRRVLSSGTLSRRMRDRVSPSPSQAKLRDLAAELCDCLARDRLLGA